MPYPNTFRPAARGGFPSGGSYAADSYTFLVRQLEKLDDKILEPLSSTSWPRDMPVITGGGFIENVASIDVSYATSGGDDDALVMESANDLPVMQADFGKTTWRTFSWAHYLSVPYLQDRKLRSIGLNMEETLNKGIRLYYDKTLDRNVYKGFTKVMSTGLCNNSGVTRASAAPHTEGDTDTEWSGKTPDEILKDINDAIAAVWYANDCSPDALPNHILVPVEQFGDLVSRKVGTDSDKSILTFLLENNLTTRQGGNLVISPCKWCAGIGASGTDRMVVYMNDPERVCFNLTAPLHRLETEICDLTYRTPYVSQFSEVRMLYPTCVRYIDGI